MAKFALEMFKSFKWWWAFPLLLVFWSVLAGSSTLISDKIDYSTQVKPILNRRCIMCHGGVKQSGGWSILFRDEALGKTKSGKYAIVPFDASSSEMMRRVTSHDPEERMPYHKEPLKSEEIDILRRWIDEGAVWGEHWAYQSVEPVAVPKPNGIWQSIVSWFSSDPMQNWAKNDIDYFVLDKLKQEKMSPSPMADKSTLLRRVSLDLTGMPPSMSLATAYFKDTSPKAYEVLVDSLLKSKHFGERWASVWLDLARYADTKGYERDDSRSIWRYRDWLIRAFNQDMPYDQFLSKQLAGDLLENPTDDDYIATAFHRNTMTNDEGGTENEEFRTAAVLDRVSTTWAALNGTTFACVQCHSHPYDPFTHEEYYKFMAFFNNTRDEDSHGDYPLLRNFAKQEDSLKVFQLKDWVAQNASQEKAKEVEKFVRLWQPAVNSLNADQFTNGELADTKWMSLRANGKGRIQHINLTGKTKLIYRVRTFQPNSTVLIRAGSHEGQLLATLKLPKTDGGWKILEADLSPINGVQDLFFECRNPAFSAKPDEGLEQFDWFYFTEAFPGEGKAGYEDMKKAFWDLLEAPIRVTTPVMMDNPKDMFRKTNLFERGNWLTKGKEVSAGTPHILSPFPKNQPVNRLGLAKWMTSTQQPLTARVMVNRLWEQLFGMGLVETLEDFGTQGNLPSHPEMLDYLAYRFMHEDGWSIKKTLKEMVMSATYQQSSKATPEQIEKDPQNKYLGRGGRIRLAAEQVRDQALVTSGVFSPKMYGRGVMPYQPKGIWESPWNGASWTISKGEDQYRRMIYTYWKRTSAYPSMLTFDGASREVCLARRIRTNTPLQALVTLNDSSYVDMSRHFMKRILQETANTSDVKTQIQKGYSLAMYKSISASKLRILMDLYQRALKDYQLKPAESAKLLAVPEAEAKPEKAALTVVANAILNLDEYVSKE